MRRLIGRISVAMLVLLAACTGADDDTVDEQGGATTETLREEALNSPETTETTSTTATTATTSTTGTTATTNTTGTTESIRPGTNGRSTATTRRTSTTGTTDSGSGTSTNTTISTGGSATTDSTSATASSSSGADTTETIEPPVEPLSLASGSQDIIDLLLGELDTATYEDSLQQCEDSDIAEGDPPEQLGAQPGVRPHLLADNADIWVMCLIELDDGQAFPLEFGTLSLVDPLGQIWGSAALSTDPEQGPVGQDRTLTVPVFATEGQTLYPVGSTYALNGYRLTTIFLQVPTLRPSGPWIARIEGRLSGSVTFETPSCDRSAGQPDAPWPIDLNARIVTVATIVEWGPDGQNELPFDGRIDHCLATPYLIGLNFEQALDEIEDAYRAFGEDGFLDAVVECDNTATDIAVIEQAPPPNGTLSSNFDGGLFMAAPNGDAIVRVRMACPLVPEELVGSTVADARKILDELDELPKPFDRVPLELDTTRDFFTVTCEGAEDVAIIERTDPPAGERFTNNSLGAVSVTAYC